MEKKKKILIMTFPQGGPKTWAEKLAENLRKRGFDVTLAAGRKDYAKQQFRYYDIVHTCVPLPNLLCKKYILTIHGNYNQEKKIARPFFRLMTGRADTVTVPSLFLKDALGIGKAEIIPNGINIPENTKADYGFAGTDPAVGILTNFHFRQKADGLISLSRIVEKISPETKLVIGGDGKLFEEYKDKILNNHKKTTFLGHCDKNDLFSKIDIFAYYSMLDNLPIAVLEAMAYGLPVISNNVGAVGEILTENLSEYIVKDEEDFGTKLKKLIDSKEEREKNGTEAKKISQDFSWEEIVKSWKDIYFN